MNEISYKRMLRIILTFSRRLLARRLATSPLVGVMVEKGISQWMWPFVVIIRRAVARSEGGRGSFLEEVSTAVSLGHYLCRGNRRRDWNVHFLDFVCSS